MTAKRKLQETIYIHIYEYIYIFSSEGLNEENSSQNNKKKLFKS